MKVTGNLVDLVTRNTSNLENKVLFFFTFYLRMLVCGVGMNCVRWDDKIFIGKSVFTWSCDFHFDCKAISGIPFMSHNCVCFTTFFTVIISKNHNIIFCNWILWYSIYLQYIVYITKTTNWVFRRIWICPSGYLKNLYPRDIINCLDYQYKWKMICVSLKEVAKSAIRKKTERARKVYDFFSTLR